MGKRIGELLYRLRKETSVTLEQLGQGLCSVSEMGEIEADQLTPDYFLFDRLFGRLGKSVDRLEILLPLEVYEIYPMCRKTPCFSYGDIRHFHRIYASN